MRPLHVKLGDDPDAAQLRKLNDVLYVTDRVPSKDDCRSPSLQFSAPRSTQLHYTVADLRANA